MEWLFFLCDALLAEQVKKQREQALLMCNCEYCVYQRGW